MSVKYFSMHIGDFLGGVIHMNAVEVGAYTMLIMAHYQAGKNGLPDDDKKLSTIAKCTMKQWLKIKPVVMEKFTLIAGFWVQSKVVDELRRIESTSTNQRAKALKRHNPPHAAALPTNNQEPITNKEEIKTYPTDSQKKEESATKAAHPPKDTTCRGHRLKAWLSSQDEPAICKSWGDWAVSQGLAVSDVSTEMKKFEDYWNARAGGGGVKLDWPATWRNWIRRVIENKREKEARNGLRRRT